VEDITRKSQHLEAELGRTSNQLKEVTAVAVDEAEKCKSAKEVIKSLTAQVRYFSVQAFVFIAFSVLLISLSFIIDI
jgi:primase-polymerase (primpol)-like protein